MVLLCMSQVRHTYRSRIRASFVVKNISQYTNILLFQFFGSVISQGVKDIGEKQLHQNNYTTTAQHKRAAIIALSSFRKSIFQL